MEIFNIGSGLFMIIIGLLVKRFPGLIAGYNTMSEERKALVDINGLSSWMRTGFVSIGILIIAGSYIFRFLDLDSIANNIMLIATLGGTFIIVIKAQRFDQASIQMKNKIIILVVFLSIFSFIISLLAYGSYPPTFELRDQTLHISGIYGMNEEIESIEIIEEMSKISKRTNGFEFNETLKGSFQLENDQLVKLFLQSTDAPYILVQTKKSPIYFNSKTKEETETLYAYLKNQWNE